METTQDHTEIAVNARVRVEDWERFDNNRIGTVLGAGPGERQVAVQLDGGYAPRYISAKSLRVLA